MIKFQLNQENKRSFRGDPRNFSKGELQRLIQDLKSGMLLKIGIKKQTKQFFHTMFSSKVGVETPVPNNESTIIIIMSAVTSYEKCPLITHQTNFSFIWGSLNVTHLRILARFHCIPCCTCRCTNQSYLYTWRSHGKVLSRIRSYLS